jgi:hypothetical protein
MKKKRGGRERPMKKGGHGYSRPREQEPRVQFYEETAGRTNVSIGGDNNGNVVIQSGSDSERNHRKTLETVGAVSSLESERSLIRTYVNNTLWKKKKFIAPSQGELDYKHHICTRILFDLKIGSTDRKHFWARNRGHVRKCLGIKRNNVVSTLKQNFMSKYIFWEIVNENSTKIVFHIAV